MRAVSTARSGSRSKVMWNRLSKWDKAFVIVFGIAQIVSYQQDRSMEAELQKLKGFTVD